MRDGWTETEPHRLLPKAVRREEKHERILQGSTKDTEVRLVECSARVELTRECVTELAHTQRAADRELPSLGSTEETRLPLLSLVSIHFLPFLTQSTELKRATHNVCLNAKV